MKRKLLTVLMALIAALCLCFGLAACDNGNGGNGGSGGEGGNSGTADSGDETDLWTVEWLYAEAQAKGFEGTLDDLIALFKGETGAQGPQGDTGAQGPKGDKGDKGETGIGVKSVEVDENGHLQVTLTDGTVLDAGKVTADAVGEAGTEGLQYQKIKGENGEYTAAVVGLGTAWDTDIVIPSTYRGLKVTAIGDSAFHASMDARSANLTSIIIPDSVTSIGRFAFDNCSSLKSIKIPNSITSIEVETFFGCSSLESIEIPDGVTSIGNNAFAGCRGLTSITIPDSVTSIREWAFAGCSGLTTVTIGSGVTSIGEYAFRDCCKLVEVWNYSGLDIKVGESNYGYVAYYAKQVYTTNEASKQTLTNEGYLFYEDENESYLITYRGNETNLTLPTKSPKGRDYKIYQYAFYCCSKLTNITIPDIVTSIGDRAFYDCSGLTSITIPDSVTSIGSFAFCDCYKLVEVWNYSDLEIKVGESDYGYVAYYAKQVYTTNEASKQTSTDDGYLFYEDENESYLITYRGNETNLTLPAKSPKGKDYQINQYAFYNCGELTSIIIPDSVTSIGRYAFEDCSGLKSVTIGKGVTSIGFRAFRDCSGLTSVTIGSGVTSIGSGVFYGCSGLTSITIPDSVTSIGEWAFGDCSGLTSVTIGSGVTSIGERAFSGCSGLTSITIPDSVTSIREWAFAGCSGLTGELKIPDSVTSIGYYAFYDCSGLTTVTIGSGVTSIGDRAFYNCSSLESITIPNSVTSIGDRAFEDCSSLTDIQFKGTVKEWQAIPKGSWWNYDTGNYTITCTDGTIDRSGNVTYFAQ